MNYNNKLNKSYEFSGIVYICETILILYLSLAHHYKRTDGPKPTRFFTALITWPRSVLRPPCPQGPFFQRQSQDLVSYGWQYNVFQNVEHDNTRSAYVKFQHSSLKTEGGVWGDRQTDRWHSAHHSKKSNSHRSYVEDSILPWTLSLQLNITLTEDILLIIYNSRLKICWHMAGYWTYNLRIEESVKWLWPLGNLH